MKPDAQPKFFKARPILYALQEAVGAEYHRLESEGIVEKVEFSEWATPMVRFYTQFLFTRNKQCLNSVLLSSLLKFWVLVLNYKCSKQMCFVAIFVALLVIFLNSSKIFTAH